MKKALVNSDPSKVSIPAARVAIGAAAIVIVLYALLHVLSPELDPSYRLLSEYANGDYAWVLALLFVTWGLGTFALAYAVRSQLKSVAGKIGLTFLLIAGLGEALSAVFDINQSLHTLTSMMGIVGLPIAAMLISVSLARTQSWTAAKKALLWAANLTWVSLVLMGVSFALLIITYTQAGGDLNAGSDAPLPDGVVAVIGYANRLVVTLYCLWAATVAWWALKLRGK